VKDDGRLASLGEEELLDDIDEDRTNAKASEENHERQPGNSDGHCSKKWRRDEEVKQRGYEFWQAPTLLRTDTGETPFSRG
jgi:hypothetical protein